jgi:lysophospholipase L1-like esterase
MDIQHIDGGQSFAEAESRRAAGPAPFTPSIAVRACVPRGRPMNKHLRHWTILAVAVLIGQLALPAPAAHAIEAQPLVFRSAANMYYVSAEVDYAEPDTGMARARSTTKGPWEDYLELSVGFGIVALVSSANGKFVSTEVNYTGADAGELRARSDAPGIWETFEMVWNSDGTYSLQSVANGLYVTAELGYSGGRYGELRARSTSIGPWEKFTTRTDPGGCVDYGARTAGPSGCQGFSTSGTWFDGGVTGLKGKELYTFGNGHTVNSTAVYRITGLDTGHSWQLQAYIPNNNANATHAHYHYCTPGPGCGDAYVNQSPYSNQWISFGAPVCTMDGTATVTLADDGGDGSGLVIGADAIHAVQSGTCDNTPPPVPGSVTATPINASTIRIAWTSSSNSNQFVISRDGVVSSPNQPGGTRNYDWGGLNRGQSYCFTLKSVNSMGASSNWSSWACATIPLLPLVPTSVTAVPASPSSIRITWGDPSHGSTQFVISQDGSQSSPNISAGTTSYTWGGLGRGQNHCYTVKSVNSIGESSAWGTTWGCTTIPPAPPQPTNVAAVPASPTSIRITWHDPSNGTTQFVVSQDGVTSSANLAAGTTSYTWGGLVRGQDHCYTVKSVNTLGESSDWSSWGCTKVPLNPPAPTGIAAAPSGSTVVRITWNDPSDGADEFVVADGTGSSPNLAPGTTGYTWSGLARGEHCYVVKSVNSLGEYSAWSSWGCATIPPLPPVPSDLTATAVSPTAITVTWSDPSAGAVQFVVSDTTTSSANQPAGTTSYTWGGLTAGTRKCFTVKAVNTIGESSAWSAYACATITIPDPPADVTAVAQTLTSIHIGWTDTSGGTTRFIVSDANTTSPTLAAGTTGYDWNGLPLGDHRCFTVTALSAIGVRSAASARACPAAPVAAYAILGDAYSAGEGAPPYDDGTATPGNGCHRSAYAFGRQYATSPPEAYAADAVQHLACSGATVGDLQTPLVSPDASLVTVTVGGNDAGLPQVLTRCATPSADLCQDYYTQDDDNNLDDRIDGLEPSLTAAYAAMKERAPAAVVVALTYPNIFRPGSEGYTQTGCATIGAIKDTDVAWLITETEHLDDVIERAAATAGVEVLNEWYAFTGHELCTPDPWVNSLTDTAEAFHPTAAGYARMAADLSTFMSAPATITPTAWSGWRNAEVKRRMPTSVQALAQLNLLRVSAPATAPYKPDDFGWTTWLRSGGCDIRMKVITRDAIAINHYQAGSRCRIDDGVWQSPYDDPLGDRAFPAGNPSVINTPGVFSPVDVDHVVSKKDAWETGAFGWPRATRKLFANDADGLELLTVQSQTNRSKEDKTPDGTPDGWTPDTSGNPAFTCDFLKMYVAAKYKWHLDVTADQYAYISNRLLACDAVTPPAAPGVVNLFPLNSHTMHITWSDHSDSDATHEIESGSVVRTVASGVTSYDWTGLAAGTAMCVRVRAVALAGVSGWRPNRPNSMCAYTPPDDTAKPPAAAAVTATAMNSQRIHIAWIDNTGAAARYEVYNGNTSMLTAASAAGGLATEFDWGGLAPDTVMCFQVRALTTGGASDWQPLAQTACATTPAVTCHSSLLPADADGYIDFYHGTSLAAAQDIAAHGVDVTRGDRDVDFGPGFYVTINRDEAADWARRKRDPTVLHFRVRAADLGPGHLCGDVFPATPGADFLAYVRAMRTFQPAEGGAGYAYTEGPILFNPFDFIMGRARPDVHGQQTTFHTAAGGALLSAGFQDYTPA